MARIDGRQLVRNIGQHLDKDSVPAGTEKALSAPALEEIDRLRRDALASVYQHAPVDQIPAGTRLALAKKVLLAFLRPLSRRQAAYNFENARLVEGLLDATEQLVGSAGTATPAHDGIRAHQLDALAESLALLGEEVAVATDASSSVASGLESASRRLVALEQDELDGTALGRRLFALEDQANGLRAQVEALLERVGVAEAGLRDAEAALKFHAAWRSQLLDRLDALPPGGTLSAAPVPATGFLPTTDHADEEGIDPAAYVRFQQSLRGDEAILRRRQQVYIDLLREKLPTPDGAAVLDLGCGDGVFLQLLAENGFLAEGVDSNPEMVRQSQGRGGKATRGDVFAFLEACEPASRDAIVSFQLVEHLRPRDLSRLLRLCRRALRPGGLVLVETLNPHTLTSHKWFAMDPTHQRFVFPELLAILAETEGLLVDGWRGLNPVEAPQRLAAVGDETNRRNVDRLNEFLFGDQDYYLVARKP